MNNMIAVILWIIALFLIAVLYLFLIAPNTSRRSQMKRYTKWVFAHRGLWNMLEGIPENSMGAFERAVTQKFGIELDVHLTKDKKLVVFHDNSLRRICGIRGTIESMTYAELCTLPLMKTKWRMPLLSDVLELVGGRVPLLIEMKMPSNSTELCPILKKALDSYRGPYLIESFNPLGLRWFHKNAPDVLIGVLSSRYKNSDGPNTILKALSTSLLVNAVCRPDFVAYNFLTADGLGFRLNQKLFKAPVFAWTIRTREQYRICRNRYDSIIFEKFIPDKENVDENEYFSEEDTENA